MSTKRDFHEIITPEKTIMSPEFQQYNGELPVILGRTEQDENFMFDLAKMPHLLIAGATAQGKSVCINNIITSLLSRKRPSELQFVLIDPKMVEFGHYAPLEKCGYLAKTKSEEDAIITDINSALKTLQSLCKELNYRLTQTDTTRTQPRIVVVIDEFEDLSLNDQVCEEVKNSVMTLAQKGHEAGIHMVIATYHPNEQVIPKDLRNLLSARIMFRLVDMSDTRYVIGRIDAAYQLTSSGDMFFSKEKKLTRVKCALIKTAEIEKIVETLPVNNGHSYALPGCE